jgi:hypothetical protein
MPDTFAMMCLRGLMRADLRSGRDVGEVMFAAVKQARADGVSDEQLRQVVADLRAEGLIPDA